MTSTQTVEFESFCQRMWLDFCDENNTILSERMTYKEYTTSYKDYLLEKYESRRNMNTSTHLRAMNL